MIKCIIPKGKFIDRENMTFHHTAVSFVILTFDSVYPNIVAKKSKNLEMEAAQIYVCLRILHFVFHFGQLYGLLVH